MQDRLDIPAQQVADLCAECYANYGTTMAGLEAKGYHLPYDEWHAAVLSRDEELASLLEGIPLPKYIFTNADIKHATICLQLLGLTHLFEVGHQTIKEGSLLYVPVACRLAYPVYQSDHLSCCEATLRYCVWAYLRRV